MVPGQDQAGHSGHESAEDIGPGHYPDIGDAAESGSLGAAAHGVQPAAQGGKAQHHPHSGRQSQPDQRGKRDAEQAAGPEGTYKGGRAAGR